MLGHRNNVRSLVGSLERIQSDENQHPSLQRTKGGPVPFEAADRRKQSIKLASFAAGAYKYVSRPGLPPAEEVRRDALPTLAYLAATATRLKKYVSCQLAKRDLSELSSNPEGASNARTLR
jgi:hypothetical protein